jgi:hypothetical protein
MGPNEHISREEMTVFAEYVLAKLAQLGKTVTMLVETFAEDDQATYLADRVALDPATLRAQDALAALDEFGEIRKIVYRYLDHPPE